MLNADSEVGYLKKGYKADVIAVKGNVISNINRLKDMIFVMKGGKTIRLNQTKWSF